MGSLVSVFGVLLFLAIIYFIFLENDLFFSLKDGSSFIVPSFSHSLFYYPSYDFFELYPSYRAYLSASQSEFSFASSPNLWDDQRQELSLFNHSTLWFHGPYREQFFSFLESYHRLAPLFFFSEMVAPSSSETRTQALFSSFSFFPFVTFEEHFEELWLQGNLLPSQPSPSISSFLLASSALTCYEGSSIKPCVLYNFSQAHLSLALNARLLFEKFPYFFLSEAFSQDVALSPRGEFFSEDFGVAAIYRFLSLYEELFFHKDQLPFFYYSCLLSTPCLYDLAAPLLFSLKSKNHLASRIFAFFLKDQKQGFIFKSGDQMMTPFLSKHCIYL